MAPDVKLSRVLVCLLSQSKEVPLPQSIENAHVLLFLGNNVTTDHISPAGSIARVSAAAKYLLSKRSVSAQTPRRAGLLTSGSVGLTCSQSILTETSVNVSPSLTPREFNSYGARRGNDAVMTRGTFASIKLQNRLIGKGGPKTLHIPSGHMVSVNVFRAERGQSDSYSG